MIYTERLAFYLVEITYFASRYFGGIIHNFVRIRHRSCCSCGDTVSDICVTGSGAPHHKWNHGMLFFAFFFSRRRDITRNRCRYSHNSSFENQLLCFATVKEHRCVRTKPPFLISKFIATVNNTILNKMV